MRFVKETSIRATPEALFAFHEAPGALTKLTPPWEKVKLVSGGDSIRPGSRAVLRTKLGPFPLDWVAEHTEYEPGRMFADRQISGPFKSWYHRHWCLPDAGGSILRDEIEYELPLGLLGRLAGGWVVRRKLRKMFDFRHQETKRLVENQADDRAER